MDLFLIGGVTYKENTCSLSLCYCLSSGIFFILFLYRKTKVLSFLSFTQNKGTEHVHGLHGDIPSLQRWLNFQVQSWVCLTAPGVILGPVMLTSVVIVCKITSHLMK